MQTSLTKCYRTLWRVKELLHFFNRR